MAKFYPPSTRCSARQQRLETVRLHLRGYLDAVCCALCAAGFWIPCADIAPNGDLDAQLTVTCGGAPAVRLAWAEDVGWSVSHLLLGDTPTPWRYLHWELVPLPPTVVEFLRSVLAPTSLSTATRAWPIRCSSATAANRSSWSSMPSRVTAASSTATLTSLTDVSPQRFADGLIRVIRVGDQQQLHQGRRSPYFQDRTETMTTYEEIFLRLKRIHCPQSRADAPGALIENAIRTTAAIIQKRLLIPILKNVSPRSH